MPTCHHKHPAPLHTHHPSHTYRLHTHAYTTLSHTFTHLLSQLLLPYTPNCPSTILLPLYVLSSPLPFVWFWDFFETGQTGLGGQDDGKLWVPGTIVPATATMPVSLIYYAGRCMSLVLLQNAFLGVQPPTAAVPLVLGIFVNKRYSTVTVDLLYFYRQLRYCLPHLLPQATRAYPLPVRTLLLRPNAAFLPCLFSRKPHYICLYQRRAATSHLPLRPSHLPRRTRLVLFLADTHFATLYNATVLSSTMSALLPFLHCICFSLLPTNTSTRCARACACVGTSGRRRRVWWWRWTDGTIYVALVVVVVVMPYTNLFSPAVVSLTLAVMAGRVFLAHTNFPNFDSHVYADHLAGVLPVPVCVLCQLGPQPSCLHLLFPPQFHSPAIWCCCLWLA